MVVHLYIFRAPLLLSLPCIAGRRADSSPACRLAALEPQAAVAGNTFLSLLPESLLVFIPPLLGLVSSPHRCLSSFHLLQGIRTGPAFFGASCPRKGTSPGSLRPHPYSPFGTRGYRWPACVMGLVSADNSPSATGRSSQSWGPGVRPGSIAGPSNSREGGWALSFLAARHTARCRSRPSPAAHLLFSAAPRLTD